MSHCNSTHLPRSGQNTRANVRARPRKGYWSGEEPQAVLESKVDGDDPFNDAKAEGASCLGWTDRVNGRNDLRGEFQSYVLCELHILDLRGTLER